MSVVHRYAACLWCTSTMRLCSSIGECPHISHTGPATFPRPCERTPCNGEIDTGSAEQIPRVKLRMDMHMPRPRPLPSNFSPRSCVDRSRAFTAHWSTSRSGLTTDARSRALGRHGEGTGVDAEGAQLALRSGDLSRLWDLCAPSAGAADSSKTFFELTGMSRLANRCQSLPSSLRHARLIVRPCPCQPVMLFLRNCLSSSPIAQLSNAEGS